MVEDEGDEDDGYAGPELPPDFDAEDIPDDEEGRFFGGGMERQTAEAMQYIDQHEEADVAVRKSYSLCSMGSFAEVAIAREVRRYLAATFRPQLRKEDLEERRIARKV